MESLMMFFESITLLIIVKWLIVIFMMVYSIFAYLMLRQVRLMTKAVSMKDDYVIRVFATAHFVFASLVLVLSILIL